MTTASRKRPFLQDLAFRLVSKKRRLPEQLPIELHSKRVYILPTRFGAFFGFFTLVMIVAGLNYNNNMALLLAFLIAGMALLTPLYTVRNLAGLKVTQASARPVFAGDNARFAITLDNHESQPRAVVCAELEGEADISDIPANGRAVLEVRQRTERRGWLQVDRIRILTRYPVGLFFSWCWVVPQARCLVYPKPEENAPALPRGHHAGTGRPEQSGDEEWAGLRDYQPGDPSRSIAWKVAARTDELVTKTFAQHESQRVELDFSALTGLNTEQRLSRLCRWVLDAHEQDLLFTLHLPALHVGPGHGEEHQHHCLRALAEHRDV